MGVSKTYMLYRGFLCTLSNHNTIHWNRLILILHLPHPASISNQFHCIRWCFPVSLTCNFINAAGGLKGFTTFPLPHHLKPNGGSTWKSWRSIYQTSCVWGLAMLIKSTDPPERYFIVWKKDICDVPRYTPVWVMTTSSYANFQARQQLICGRACCTVCISYIFNNNYWVLSVTPVFSRLQASCSH